MKYYFLSLILTFILSFILLEIFVPILKKTKLGQPINKYVENHKQKSGTPTMGGLFFIIPSIIISLFFVKFSNRAYMILAIGFAYLTVGFLDDFIKLKFNDNQGLKPYQKIIFQISIALIAGFFAYKNGITDLVIPFSKKSINIGFYSIFLIIFIFIAITNSVNLTDGIDGLASSVSLIYLIFLATIICFETKTYSFYFDKNLYYIIFSIIGGLFAFLIFNFNKACIFMGDTGSLSLGGFIGAISIFTCNSLIIAILGIMFVVSSISVIIQVIYYKRTKKRIFLMAPYHHHLQLKGVSEGKICYIYSLITAFIGILLNIVYL